MIFVSKVYHEPISREWQDSELLALHFTTVASFNVQHPAQFIGEALATLRYLYLDHLDRGTPVSDVRGQMASAFEGKTRVLRDRIGRRHDLHLSEQITMLCY